MVSQRVATRPVSRPSPRRLEWPDTLLNRIRAEYREMPGLCLTLRQACRLWQMDPADCTRVLDALVAERFLIRTPAGTYIASR